MTFDVFLPDRRRRFYERSDFVRSLRLFKIIQQGIKYFISFKPLKICKCLPSKTLLNLSFEKLAADSQSGNDNCLDRGVVSNVILTFQIRFFSYDIPNLKIIEDYRRSFGISPQIFETEPALI